MEITVNVKGLEGLTSVLERLISVEPVNTQGISATSFEASLPAAAPVQAYTPPASPTMPTQQPTLPTANAPSPQVPSPSLPTTAQTYTREQLAVAATQITDAGRTPEIMALLASFGVQALTQLPTEQYGAFATALRGLGARI